MHPEVRQRGPGSCPKCGMALEPVDARTEDDDSELIDMRRRFVASAALTLRCSSVDGWPPEIRSRLQVLRPRGRSSPP
jgi:hypothetical protein